MPGRRLGLAVLFGLAACGGGSTPSSNTQASDQPVRQAAPAPDLRARTPDRQRPEDGVARQDDHRPNRGDWKRFDNDGDGQLSDSERAAMRQERAQRMVGRLDSDGDGRISADELAASRMGGRIDFATADTNHDGYLSPDELAAAMPDRHGWHGGGGGDDGSGDGSATAAP